MINEINGASANANSANKPNGSEKSVLGRDEFLKLLTFQLRAQNPMKPYDNQEFASQLAQFSQLEQLIDIRSLLEEQMLTNAILTQTMSNSALPGMLGKTAKAFTNQIQVSGVNDNILGFDTPYNVSSGKMTITDSGGGIVNVIELSGNMLNKGTHTINWDGTDSNGDKVPDGNYNFTVELFESNGNGFSADTFTKGKIDAVRFKSDGTKLVINGMELPLNAISDITTDN
jgi:flagellar basal-body rod modification protein FlgD